MAGEKRPISRGATAATSSSSEIITLDDDPIETEGMLTSKKNMMRPTKATRNYSESDSDDEDYYTNLFERKRQKTTHDRKESPKKAKPIVLDDSLSDDDSIFDDVQDDDLPLAERLRLNVEEREKKEKAEAEKELETIRSKALKAYDVRGTTNVYVNRNVDEVKQQLRYIREIESKLDTSPSARIRMLGKTLGKEKVRKTGEVVTIIVDDLEGLNTTHPNYEWPLDETFERLREIIAEKWNVDAKCVRLEGKDAMLICNGHSPKNIGLQPFEYTRITAMIVGGKIPRIDLSQIELKCQIQGGHRPRTIKVKKDTSFAAIKPLIMDVWKIASISRLVFDAQDIADHETPQSLDIDDGSVLDVHQ